MLAVRLHGIGDVRLEEVAEPPAPGPSEVIIAPLWAGLCGTDAREYFGPGGSVPDEPHVLTGIHKPVIIGHEFSGRVTAVGSAVSGVGVGEHVAVFPLVTCGRCANCLRGDAILCPVKAWVGLSTRYGGLGDLVLVEDSMVSPLGEIDPMAGAMIEPAAVAFEAATTARIQPGDAVLVSGCGPIGLLAILAARARGASMVFANDPQSARGAKAESLGATIVPPDALGAEAAIRKFVPEGVAAALNCAGESSSLDCCIQVMRPGGVISVPAVHARPPVVDLWRVTRSSLSVIGSLGYTRDAWDRTIALVASGAYPIESLTPVCIDRDHIIEDGLDRLRTGGVPTKILVRVGADDE